MGRSHKNVPDTVRFKNLLPPHGPQLVVEPRPIYVPPTLRDRDFVVFVVNHVRHKKFLLLRRALIDDGHDGERPNESAT